MPHITLECTSNIKMDFQSFFKELAEGLIDTGHAPQMGIKCRLEQSDIYYIIDGDENYKMANLLVRLREGRSQEVLESFSNIGMGLLQKYLQQDVLDKKVILSTEIKELKKGLDLTKNAIR